jgi:hypothetical protein
MSKGQHMRSGTLTVLASLVCATVMGCGSAKSTQTTSTAPASQGATAPTPPTLSGQAAAAAVVQTLRRYEQAFSNHDAAALASLLAPSVQRYGVGSGGCTTSRGRTAVLAVYRSQFATGSGQYRLPGLSPSAVSITGDAARVALPYRLSSGSSGHVRFVLHPSAGTWQISSIAASCTPSAARPTQAPTSQASPTQTRPATPTAPPVEGPGSTSHATDSEFCATHDCIGSFTTEPGYIVQCSDGTYSHSGGISGSCSRHGGNG